MSDWKSKAAEHQRAEQEAAERRRAIWEAEVEAKKAARLREHQRRFFCHICGKKSRGPREASEESWIGEVSFTSHYEDWDYPDGLHPCSSCRKWTCEDDLYDGVCKCCWEKKLK